jgi:ParB family chromosome partitioning protein
VGYPTAATAAKTDLNVTYVRGIIQLLAKGEERLLQAVEKGQIPLSIAITIATSDDKNVQRALTEAYERNDLRGKALMRARSLIETRRARGKSLHGGPRPKSTSPVAAANLLKTYRSETLRQKMVVQKSKICEARLLFATTALKQLLHDDNFVTLLRAESLDTLPQHLALHINPDEVNK